VDIPELAIGGTVTTTLQIDVVGYNVTYQLRGFSESSESKITSKSGMRDAELPMLVRVWIRTNSARAASCSASVRRSVVRACSSGESGSESPEVLDVWENRLGVASFSSATTTPAPSRGDGEGEDDDDDGDGVCATPASFSDSTTIVSEVVPS